MPRHSKSLSRHFALENTEAELSGLNLRSTPHKLKGLQSKSVKSPSFQLRDESNEEGLRTHLTSEQEESDLQIISAQCDGQVPLSVLQEVYQSRSGGSVNNVLRILAEMGFLKNKEAHTSVEASTRKQSPEDEGEDYWDYLPQDLKLKIWESCSLRDQAKFARVSKEFNAYATQSRGEIRQIKIPRGISGHSICSMLLSLPNLVGVDASIFLSKSSGYESSSIEANQLCSALEEVVRAKEREEKPCLTNITIKNSTAISWGYLQKLYTVNPYFRSFCFAGCAELTSFKIPRNIKSSYKESEDQDQGKGNSSGLEIDLAGCTHIPGSDLAALLANTGQVQSLDFSRNPNVDDKHFNISPRSGIITLRALNCRKLTRVRIGLPKEHPLESLNLSGCQNLALVHIVAANLQILNLSHCSKLFALSLKAKKLEKLVLTQCSKLYEIDEESKFLHLKSLNIDNCSALEHPDLQRVLDQSKELEEFRASGCSSLYRIELEHHPRLKSLDVSGCRELRTLLGNSENLILVMTQNCTSLTDCNLDLGVVVPHIYFFREYQIRNLT